VTSHSFALDMMDKLFCKFTAEVDPLMGRKTINKYDVFVFDETYIGARMISNSVLENNETLAVKPPIRLESMRKL